LSAAAFVKDKNSRKRQNRKRNMKLDEIKNTTKAAIDQLIRSLESGHSEVLAAYLSAMAHFPDYSLGNVMLIASQRPSATQVCGMRAWNALGRFVKRSEKGIVILAPMVGHRRLRQQEIAVDESANQEHTQQLIGFRAVYVFDIAQTEGRDLPGFREVQGEVGPYTELLHRFLFDKGISLKYSETIAPAKGVSQGGTITLLPAMEPAEEFATLVHETAHEMLHRGERRASTTKRIRETEAEAVAFVVCHSLQLETGSASADYIQLYQGDGKLLLESLELILQTAGTILGALSSEDVKNQPRESAQRMASSRFECS
jgi:N-terminal domain of anti-restriction factor ArdC